MKLAFVALLAGCSISAYAPAMQTRHRDLRPSIGGAVVSGDDDSSTPTAMPDNSPPQDPWPAHTDIGPQMIFTTDGSIEQARPIGAGMYEPIDGGAPVMGTPAN